MGDINNMNQQIKRKKVVYWIIVGLIITIFELLAIQFWRGIVTYYSHLNFTLLLTGTTVAIVAGIMEVEIKRRVTNSLSSLELMTAVVLAFGIYSIHSFSRVVVAAIIINVTLLFYFLAYRLHYWVKKLDFSVEERERKIAKNYQSNVQAFNYLRRLLLIIDGGVVISWLINQEVDSRLLLVTGLIFFLQFILLAVSFYRAKRIVWLANNRNIHPEVLLKLISLISIVVGIVFIFLLLLVGKEYGIWSAVISRLKFDLFNSELWSGVDFIEFGKRAIDGQLLKGNYVSQSTNVSWLFFLLMSGIWLLIIGSGLGLVWIVGRGMVEFFKQKSFTAKQVFQLLRRIYCGLKKVFTNITRTFQGVIRQVNEKDQLNRERRKRKPSINKQQSLFSQIEEPGTYEEEIIILFRQSKKLFNDYNLYQEPTETLQEYLQKVKRQLTSTSLQIIKMKKLLIEVLYSDHQITEIDVKQMKAAVNTVEKIYGEPEADKGVTSKRD